MTTQRWAIVELMGRRSYVGIISEVQAYGATMLRVEALERDGTFTVHLTNATSLYCLSEVTEEEARRRMVPRWSYACGAYSASMVLPGACSTCGREEGEHGQRMPLLAATLASDDDEGDHLARFTCDTCGETKPRSEGNDDDRPDTCDACYEAEAPPDDEDAREPLRDQTGGDI